MCACAEGLVGQKTQAVADVHNGTIFARFYPLPRSLVPTGYLKSILLGEEERQGAHVCVGYMRISTLPRGSGRVFEQANDIRCRKMAGMDLAEIFIRS